jgi:peptide/nickel transport system permease protein
MIYGSRISIIVAFTSIACAGVLGTVLGLVSGYFEGRVDSIVMRLTDIMLAMPYILIAIVIVAVLGASLINIILVIAVMTWAGYARMVRGEVLAVKHGDFVALAKIVGCGSMRILRQHIFPNVFNTLIILATLQLGTIILFEAALSFLGMGVPPPDPSWGGMVADGRDYITTAWWVATFPGLAIVATVLACNLLGDWLRDALDPKLRQI